MDVWRLFGAALRRWYVFVAVAALGFLAAMSASRGVDPEFTSSSSLMLVPPAVSAPGNPYQDLPTAGQAVMIVLQSGATRSKLAAEGLSTDYDVTSGSRTPIMGIVVRAHSGQQAMATGKRLIAMGQAELRTRQLAARIQAPVQVTAQVLSGPNEVSISTSDRLRVQVVVLGLSGAIAFLLAVFFDDVVLLVRQRRSRLRADARLPRKRRWRKSDDPSGRNMQSGADPTATGAVTGDGDGPDDAPAREMTDLERAGSWRGGSR